VYKASLVEPPYMRYKQVIEFIRVFGILILELGGRIPVANTFHDKHIVLECNRGWGFYSCFPCFKQVTELSLAPGEYDEPLFAFKAQIPCVIFYIIIHLIEVACLEPVYLDYHLLLTFKSSEYVCFLAYLNRALKPVKMPFRHQLE